MPHGPFEEAEAVRGDCKRGVRCVRGVSQWDLCILRLH